MSKRSGTEVTFSKDVTFLTLASVSRYSGAESDQVANDRKVEDVKKPKLAVSNSTKIMPLVPKKGIQIKLSSQKDNSQTTLKAPSKTVASVFGHESDDEPEEMPPEARMRMRNIGRDTPTSAGPNSYGKTKQGFCNVKKVFEKTLKEAALEVSDDKQSKTKPFI